MIPIRRVFSVRAPSHLRQNLAHKPLPACAVSGFSVFWQTKGFSSRPTLISRCRGRYEIVLWIWYKFVRGALSSLEQTKRRHAGTTEEPSRLNMDCGDVCTDNHGRWRAMQGQIQPRSSLDGTHPLDDTHLRGCRTGLRPVRRGMSRHAPQGSRNLKRLLTLCGFPGEHWGHFQRQHRKQANDCDTAPTEDTQHAGAGYRQRSRGCNIGGASATGRPIASPAARAIAVSALPSNRLRQAKVRTGSVGRTPRRPLPQYPTRRRGHPAAALRGYGPIRRPVNASLQQQWFQGQHPKRSLQRPATMPRVPGETLAWFPSRD